MVPDGEISIRQVVLRATCLDILLWRYLRLKFWFHLWHVMLS